MIVYYFLFAVVIILAILLCNNHVNSLKNAIFLYIALSLMTCIIGLRDYRVGEDTIHYANIFRSAKYMSFGRILSRVRVGWYTNQFGYTETIESGFLMICKIISIFSDNYHVFLFVISAVTYGLVAIFIRDNSKNFFVSVYVVLCDYFFMRSFNEMRQLLAVSIVMQAYTQIKKHNYFSAIFIILVASYIHNSSLICFAIFPIMIIESMSTYRSFKIVALAALGSPLILSISKPIVNKYLPIYSHYMVNSYWDNSLGGSIFLYVLEVVFIIFLYKNGFFGSNDLYILSILTLIYISFEFMGFRFSVLGRISYFFRCYLILLFPEVFRRIKGRKRIIIELGSLVLMFLLYASYTRIPSRFYVF